MIIEIKPDATPINVTSGDGAYPAFAGRASKITKHAGHHETVFGYFISGGMLRYDGYTYPMRPGSYFACPGPCTLMPTECHFKGEKITPGVLYIIRDKYKGFFHIGGPIEAKGRLLYIDGCSDSLIIGPPKKGDPCLNHLHFPGGIKQTMHIHPTSRVGVVAGGRGSCRTPARTAPLETGLCWYIPPGGEHCFHTQKDETMDVVAWHPDSDCGPTDDSHPMIRKTIVNGQPAHLIPDIRTKQIE